jgi:hypothetical protein
MEERVIKTIAIPCPRCLRVTLHYVYASKVECALCHEQRERIVPSRRNGDG